MSISGRFFVPQAALEAFEKVYLPSHVRQSDSLGALIRLCDFADFRKHSTSNRTGAQLDIYRIYPESIHNLSKELPMEIYNSILSAIIQTSGIKLVVDPNPNVYDQNGNPALPGIVGLMPHRSPRKTKELDLDPDPDLEQ